MKHKFCIQIIIAVVTYCIHFEYLIQLDTEAPTINKEISVAQAALVFTVFTDNEIFFVVRWHFLCSYRWNMHYTLTTRIRVYCNKIVCCNTWCFVAISTYCHKTTFVGSRCDWTHGNRLLPRKSNCGNKACYRNIHARSCHMFSRGNTHLMPQFALWR